MLHVKDLRETKNPSHLSVSPSRFSGYAFSFGGQNERSDTTFIGTTSFGNIDDPAFWFFQYTFSATSVTIVAGTLAERCQMAAYLCYSVVLAGFVYPVVAHSIWSNNGFLSISNIDPFLDSGVVDFAGSGVVHITGGTTALLATMILGPRRGRFYDAQGEPLDTPKSFPGHSVALQLLGTMILWFGCKSKEWRTRSHFSYRSSQYHPLVLCIRVRLQSRIGFVAQYTGLWKSSCKCSSIYCPRWSLGGHFRSLYQPLH